MAPRTASRAVDTEHTRQARDPLAPLPRTMLDATAPIVRAVFGAAFVAYSSYATIFLFAQDTAPLFIDAAGHEPMLGALPIRFWCGILLALGFFLGELYTAERYPRAYRAILTPDTIYTARQLFTSFRLALVVLAPDQTSLYLIIGLLAAGQLLIAYGATWPLQFWFLACGLCVGGLLLIIAVWGIDTGRVALAIVEALNVGYIVARFGEVFLFGKRRRGG